MRNAANALYGACTDWSRWSHTCM